jgi:hypothetical protein
MRCLPQTGNVHFGENSPIAMPISNYKNLRRLKIKLSGSINQRERTIKEIRWRYDGNTAHAGPAAKPVAVGPASTIYLFDILRQTGGERRPMTKLTKNRTKNMTNRTQAI